MLPLSSLHADTRTPMPMPKPVTVGFTYGQESALTVYQAKKKTTPKHFMHCNCNIYVRFCNGSSKPVASVCQIISYPSFTESGFSRTSQNTA